MSSRRTGIGLALTLALLVTAGGVHVRDVKGQTAGYPANAFENPSFELGRDGWDLSLASGTVARFTVDSEDAADGDHSALVTVDAVASWGAQFGQSVDVGQKGKTYTFAVLAKSVKGTAAVDLDIERSADPWDKAARSEAFTLKEGEWTELHVTFKVAADFPQGWTAYVACSQPGARFRVDMFRLYEGDYVPYKQAVSAAQTPAAVRLFDTGAPSAQPLSAAALTRRDGWTELRAGDVTHAFAGDTVILNNALAVVLRRTGTGAEVYSVAPGGAATRALLSPVGSAPASRLASVRIVRSGPGGAALAATYEAPGTDGLTLSLELKMGHVFVATEPGPGVTALRIEAPCRFAVLPDFFADDIVVDATDLPVAEAELPGENFLLHMLPDRNAIMMAVWTPSGTDVGITLSGRGAQRVVNASQIGYGEGGKIWVAVLSAPQVWHTRDVADGDAGNIVRLDWKAPFTAAWRTDWRREDGLTDSWEMAVERPNGGYIKPGWFGGPDSLDADRRRWTTVLGWFEYPCWTDKAGQGYLQPLKEGERFRGPALIYPINRVGATPLDAYTVIDVVRSTLGVGPCEYILDVEKQASEYKGMATCECRDTLNPIYEKGEQKQKRAVVEETLADVLIFIRHIRGRIEGYVAFGHEMNKYIEDQKAAHPELAQPLTDLEKFSQAIDQRVAERKDKIQTVEYAAKLVDEFRATLLDYEGPDALAKCKGFTEAWVDMGGNQDELAGECRWAVKVLRQRAALTAAADPRISDVAREIRKRTQEVMRSPAGHEGARH